MFRLFEDSRGDIWIGRRMPTSDVLTRWERATGRFHRYSSSDGLPAFNRTTAFAEDRDGAVWIGFWNGGLARYKAGRFTRFGAAHGAPAGGVSAFFVDARQQLWIGASHPMLSRVESIDADQPRFIPYSVAPALRNDAVSCITEDREGRLYLGMDSGRLVRFDPVSGRVRHYTSADGLRGSVLTSAFRDRSGILWFGGYSGLFRLVPGSDRPPSSPAVLIGSLRVAGHSYLVSDLGQAAVRPFELTSAQNQLQIGFFGLGAGIRDGLRYQYRLEGADDGWNEPTSQRDVNYASLSPGRYRFVVRGVALDGGISQHPATVDFTILPPLWQRWWFRSGIVMIALLVVVAGHRYRVARLLALERVRMRIAADLHDDIGGSLSRISIQSEVARREAAALGDHAVSRLGEIAESARGLVDALGDVVWSVDPRRDDLASVFRRLREYADDLLTGCGVRWTYTASPHLEDVRLDPQARRNLFLILKEAVTNVARHASARSVSLDIELTDRQLCATLRDDGVGFDPDAIDRARSADRHGIDSMRARAAHLGGTLSVESSAAGTTLSLRMSVRQRRMIMLLPRRSR